MTTKKAEAEQAKSIAEIDAERKLSDTPVEEQIDSGAPIDPNLPADFGMGPGPVSPPVTMGPATVLDIPANVPYPTGNPYEPSYAEINGLPVPPVEPVK